MKKIGRPKSDTPKSRLLSLRMTVDDYKKLQEGTSLSVTWQGDTLVSFIITLE